LERLESLQETINELKTETTKLKQDKFAQIDQVNEMKERANQLDVENNKLTIKMKQLKDLLEQRDETIARIREKMVNESNDQTIGMYRVCICVFSSRMLCFLFSFDCIILDLGELLSKVDETNTESNQELLSTIDNDVEKANQHMRELHKEIDEKTRRIKDLDSLLNQEKDRYREMETKLKVVLELRERDAHLHIRQLGQTDAELRKARTDTERVRILQQQLELKQYDRIDRIIC
jgi:chromosome segregation ATPase